MNENIKLLVDTVDTDVSGKWVGVDKLENFASNVVAECIRQLNHANAQHCAYTTHDQGTVDCVKQKIVKHLTSHFNITQKIGEIV